MSVASLFTGKPASKVKMDIIFILHVSGGEERKFFKKDIEFFYSSKKESWSPKEPITFSPEITDNVQYAVAEFYVKGSQVLTTKLEVMPSYLSPGIILNWKPSITLQAIGGAYSEI